MTTPAKSAALRARKGETLMEGLKRMGFEQQPGVSFDKDGTPLTTFSLKLNPKKPAKSRRRTRP